MNEYVIEDQFLINESDVEQKVVWPLLTNPIPIGLGYNNTHIQTKSSLKQLKIEKGKNSKLYYPDYIIYFEGLPLIVIEAKKPNDNLEEGYREARLYSHEINSLFESGLNPCKLIMSFDGVKLLAGKWDDNQPLHNILIENFIPTDSDFSDFINSFNINKLKKTAKQLRTQLRTTKKYKKPLHLLGGKHIRNQQVKNTFGETISIQYRHLFNPTVESERIDIVENAYVKVQKHMAHVNPIDRLIRMKIRPSTQDTLDIENNITPNEITKKLENAEDFNNHVLLLIGSVGSGKSTFTTFLKEVALSYKLKIQLEWVRLDLNEAPVNSLEIYKWLKKEICIQLSKSQPSIDEHSMEMIKKIFEDEVSDFNKLALEFFSKDSALYKEKLFNHIQSITSDLDIKLNAYIRFFVHNSGKQLIIILDNCDKRNLEEQLLMFEVANWLKNNSKSIVFLPLRETTFDHHRHEKPLDTVVKDLIFRINPPSLEKVMYNRIKYAKRLSDNAENQNYYLRNGIRVSYPSKDELSYLQSILKSLFQNTFFKKLITGLAGRDIRKGIEYFLDFCKSGHITENEILKMKLSDGNYALPNYLTSRVFIRGNRLYYNDADAKVKNLFFSEPSDDFPDPFTRIAILRWLQDRSSKRGPSNILGFHKIGLLIKELNILGHSIKRLEEEIKYLIKSTLIISESQNENNIDFEELISINPPGIVHLEMLSNLDYLSSCAEDFWFREENIANKISDRIAGKSCYSHFSLNTTILNSEDFIQYLEKYSDYFFSVQKKIISSENYNFPINFDKINDSIERFKKSIGASNLVDFEINSVVQAKIVNIFDSGLICELDESSQTGFLPLSEFEDNALSSYDISDEIQVVIIEYNAKHKKYTLSLNS